MRAIVSHLDRCLFFLLFLLYWLSPGLSKQLPSNDNVPDNYVLHGDELLEAQASALVERQVAAPAGVDSAESDSDQAVKVQEAHTTTTIRPQPVVVLKDLSGEIVLAVIFGSMAGSCLLTLIVYCSCVLFPSISGQILPRSSSNWMIIKPDDVSLSDGNVSMATWTDDSTTVSGSFGVSPDTLDFLKVMFEKRARVTVPSSSTQFSQPKNAVLIDSFLLKSTATRPTDAPVVTSTPGRSIFNSDVQTTLTTDSTTQASTTNKPELRQAKQGQTGRPNSFFLDDDNATDQQLEAGAVTPNFDDIQTEAGRGGAQLPPPGRTDQDILASTTVDPFASFYGLSNPGQAGNQSGTMKNLPFPFAISQQEPPGQTNLISGHFSVQDAPSNSAGVSGQGPTPQQPSGAERKAGKGPPPPPFQVPGRRQGSVAAAPAPLQPDRPPPSWQTPRRGGPAGPPSDGLPPPFQARPLDPPSLDGHDNEIKLETCSIGDDSTCNDGLNEVCRVDEDGAATCLCRMGSARLRLREPCKGMWSYLMYIRLNRVQDAELRFGLQFADRRSRPYLSLERQVVWGVDSLMRSSQFGNQYTGSRLNSFSPIAEDGLLANMTVSLLRDSPLTSDPSSLIRSLQETATEQLRLSQRRLGVSNLYVGSLLTAVPSVQDVNECMTPQLNDCPANVSTCTNTIGSFVCSCRPGYGDRHAGDPLRSGRSCENCEDVFCNQHGICLLDTNGQKMCRCSGWYIGATCQTDGQVVAVACGSSAIALILIVITLVFLLRWSRGGASSRGSNSTLGRSDVSGTNTFTYVKNSPPLATLSQDPTMNNRVRMAYLVHPSLLSQSQMATRRGATGGLGASGSDQLLDSNFYEVRPPPGRLGPSQAMIAAELLYRKQQQQRSGSRDQLHVPDSDLSSLESPTNQHLATPS